LRAQLQGEAAKLEVECKARVNEARKKDRAEIAELDRRCHALEQASLAKERESKRIRASMETAHTQAATSCSTSTRRSGSMRRTAS
jgi:hypothetical protein